MKEEDYISKGNLELYLLDALSRNERRRAEGHFDDPEVVAEKAGIEEVLEQMAFADARKPPASLRNKVLSDIGSPKDSITSAPKGYSRYWIAASVTVALFASFMSYVFWSNWQSTERDLEIALNENTVLADQAQLTNQRLEDAQQGIAILSDPAFKQIQLKGLESYPDYLTSVYWNPVSKETFLQINNLGTLNEDQQYQLWSIQDGKPVDAGVFDIADGSALIPMKSNDAPQAFAITIEPRGGSISPTLEKMVVIGNVSV